MNEMILVTNENGKAMTTSLKIAEVFGKEHKNVIAKIKEKISLFNELNFKPVDYIDSKGETRPMYLLDRDFTTFLIMGFTGSKADEFKLKYIEAFNQMEKIIMNELRKLDSYLIEDPIERAERWIEEEKERKALEVKNAKLDADNKKLKPAATYAMDVLHHNKNLTSIDAVGRELGLNKNAMHKLLRDVGILCKCGSKYVLAAGHEDLGKGRKEFFLEKTYRQKDKTRPIPNDLAVSEKGRGYIIKHFDEWKEQAYGENWREELWSKAQLAEYNESIADIM